MTHYEPANSFETPRFSDMRTFMRLPNVQDLDNARSVAARHGSSMRNTMERPDADRVVGPAGP